MNEKQCLSDQDLILHYYGELPANNAQVRHLTGCPHCAERFAALSRDLDQLPHLAYEPDHAVGTRMAARLGERLQKRRRRWLPALGAAAAAAVALVVTMMTWTPHTPPVHTAQVTPQIQGVQNYDDDLPDLDFLDDLDLLQNLDVLSQIEGV
jgi:anti-sigma factor RsiW